jgi:hypothetical protein
VIISVSIPYQNTTVSLLDRSKRFDYPEDHQFKGVVASQSELGHICSAYEPWGCSKTYNQVSSTLLVPVSRSCRLLIVQCDRCKSAPTATIVGYVTN